MNKPIPPCPPVPELPVDVMKQAVDALETKFNPGFQHSEAHEHRHASAVRRQLMTRRSKRRG